MDLALKQRILDDGFKKKGNYYYRQGSTDGFQDMIGFSYANYYSDRAVSPVVFIYNSLLDRLYLNLLEKKNKPGYPGMALFGFNIGYLFPDHNYYDWYFRDYSEIPNICNTIIKEIRKFAYPFFKEYQNIERIIDAYENNNYYGPSIDLGERFYKQPLLYSAIGEHDKGIELISLIKDLRYIKCESQETYYNNYIKYATEQKKGI